VQVVQDEGASTSRQAAETEIKELRAALKEMAKEKDKVEQKLKEVEREKTVGLNVGASTSRQAVENDNKVALKKMEKEKGKLEEKVKEVEKERAYQEREKKRYRTERDAAKEEVANLKVKLEKMEKDAEQKRKIELEGLRDDVMLSFDFGKII
jgi:chromosome segregation ATPase